MKTSLNSCKGSALVVALVLAAAIMVTLGGYMSLVNLNLRTSNRGYHASAAMNVAETGLEEAMWSINELRLGSTTSFDGWTINGIEATKAFSGLQIGTTSSNQVKVWINDYNLSSTATPKIVARATLQLPTETSPVEKWVEVKLQRASNRPRGLVSKYTIKFNGNNPTVDSWNSNPDKDAATPAIPYSTATGVRNDKGFVGSPYKLSVDNVTVQNANIWGYVATYNDPDLSNNVGPNGSIKAFTSPTNVKIDPTRVSTDFTATLKEPTAPDTSSLSAIAISNEITFDDAYVAANGKDWTDPADNVVKRVFLVAGISLNNKGITVSASKPVVLVVPSPYDVDIGGGSGYIQINNNSALSMYCGGDVKIAGNGVSNGEPATSGGTLTSATVNQPIRFQLFGTALDTDNNPTTATQSISVTGNGAFSGVIDAPNADVTINGNGDILGSCIGNLITLTGNAQFHYDESLADGDVSGRLLISSWRELTTAAERATYSTKL
jgi:Tfp pilus assembly protein PilX